MSILSLEDLELTAKIQLYPFMMLTIAKLKPVLPDVVSIIVSPGIKFLSFQLLLYIMLFCLLRVTWIKGFYFGIEITF
jgi:hypothetical protein